MKTLESLIYENQALSVLVDEIEDGKARVDYFINGLEITDFGTIKPVYQMLFTVIADDVCSKLNFKNILTNMENQFSLRKIPTEYEDRFRFSIENDKTNLSLETIGCYKENDVRFFEIEGIVETLNRNLLS